MKLRRSLAVLLALVTQLSAPAFAQSDADKLTARELAREAQDALEKKDFATAADRFGRADSLFHAPTLVLGLARAQVGLGKLIAAQENYNKILREKLPPGAPEPFVQAVEEAKKELQAITPQIPWVIVKLDGPQESKVKVDGDDLPSAAVGVKRAIDPGKHVVRAEAKGFLPAEKEFTVAAGTTETVDLKLLPAPQQTSPDLSGSSGLSSSPVPASSGGLFPHQETVGIIALGLGSAGAVVGVVTGALAIGKRSDLVDAGCSDTGGCPASQKDALGSYHTLGTLSTIGFIGAGVGVTAGVVLLLTAPKAPKSAAPVTKAGVTITPYFGLDQIGAVGRF